MALLSAKQISGNFRTISFGDFFQGSGFAASSAGGEEHFKGGQWPMVMKVFKVEFSNYYRNPRVTGFLLLQV